MVGRPGSTIQRRPAAAGAPRERAHAAIVVGYEIRLSSRVCRTAYGRSIREVEFSC